MNGHRFDVLIAICSALLVGVLFRSVFSVSFEYVFLALLVSLLIVVVSLYYKGLVLMGVLSVGIVAGYGWHAYVSPDSCNQLLDSFVGKPVSVEGFVSSESSVKGVSQTFVLDPTTLGISFRGQMYPVSLGEKEQSCLLQQSFRVSADIYPEVSFGDKVVVSGNIDVPENFVTDAGREFDYVSYLGKDSIFYTISFSQLEIVEEKSRGGFRRSLFDIKDSFLNQIKRMVPEPESALLGGILLGEKESLGEEVEKSFVRTGLIHIVVLSGYNVSLVADAIARVLVFLPTTLAYAASSAGILSFMVLTGAHAPIVRASIMAILLLIAKFLGRPASSGRLLLVVATIMVLENPAILVHDVSFHLSFLATAGLLFIFPKVETVISPKIPSLLGLREIASASISTQIAVLPYLLWSIGSFSIISPLTNIIILPFVPLGMLLGFLGGILSYICYPFAKMVSFVTTIVLSTVVHIVSWFSKIPFSLVTIPDVSFMFVIIAYILMWYYFLYKKLDE